MKAAVLTGIRRVELVEVAEPVFTGEADVLLRVDSVGVCGSDMHYYRSGRIGGQVIEYPWIIGHECCATVLEAGPAVKHLRPGVRVAVDPLVWCNSCDQCVAGRENTCRNQAFLGCPGQMPGCLTERIVMPAANCVALGDDIDSATAVTIEPLSIGLYADRLARQGLGARRIDGIPRLGILGAGPIGLSVLLAAQSRSAVKTYVTDIRDNRLELAATMGADWTGNPQTQDVVAAVAASEPLGLDYVFECAGEQETLDQAMEMLAPGGKLLIVGIPEFDRISLAIDPLRRREIIVQPVRRQNRCLADTVRLAGSGRINPGVMVTHEFGFDQTRRAFEMVADYQDNVVKAVIHVSGQ